MTAAILRQVIKRLVYRFITLPTYTLVFIPWIFVFLMTVTNYDVNQKVASMLAFLAGKPGEAVLNGYDVARALAIIFALVNILFELFYALTGLHKKWPFYKIEGVAKAILVVGGWLAFLAVAREGIMVAIVFTFISLGLIGLEFFVIWFFANARPALPSSKIR